MLPVHVQFSWMQTADRFSTSRRAALSGKACKQTSKTKATDHQLLASETPCSVMVDRAPASVGDHFSFRNEGVSIIFDPYSRPYWLIYQ